MPATHAPPPAADACASTPAAARALLAILFAPLMALLESRLATLFASLEAMMQQWHDGTLPPPPPERAPRTPAPRTTPIQPSSRPESPWLARLMALAASDHQGSARAHPTPPRPRHTDHAAPAPTAASPREVTAPIIRQTGNPPPPGRPSPHPGSLASLPSLLGVLALKPSLALPPARPPPTVYGSHTTAE